MSEAGYVELPIIQWLSGQGGDTPDDKGLGWAYRDEETMAAFDRPLEDPLVEKLLAEAIIRINPEVTTETQARVAVSALRKAMAHPAGGALPLRQSAIQSERGEVEHRFPS